MENWTLTEEQVKQILETEPREIPESNVFIDTQLSKEERIKHAKQLLEKWKNEVNELNEKIDILREEKEQMKNDALFHRQKADEYLRQLKSDN
jgi:predicted ribosome quality control (RQC) complex YloA/Tae2 family protein